ncbi:MAG: hypothetical protein LJE70_08435 [Chromatiaceae bacterium]|nr:hypothetical protein [Chromatiaceae bacterium]
MFPLLIGFGSALLFGLFAFGTYGREGITGDTWIIMVFVALIISGLLVFLANRTLPCWVCRLTQRMRSSQGWCGDCESPRRC